MSERLPAAFKALPFYFPQSHFSPLELELTIVGRKNS
jgi:hypothetical protein